LPLRGMNSPRNSTPLGAFRHLLTSEAGSGIILISAAAAALVVVNSPASSAYFAVLQASIAGFSVLEWINDPLMAVFFLIITNRSFVDEGRH
jgi:NhaA family Na+:H+ antiporter